MRYTKPIVAIWKGLVLAEPGKEEVPVSAARRELLIENRLERCEEILRIARWGNHGKLSAGRFGRSIALNERTFMVSVGRFDYFFSSPIEDWTGTTPVLIKCHTNDRRWEKVAAKLKFYGQAWRGSSSERLKLLRLFSLVICPELGS